MLHMLTFSECAFHGTLTMNIEAIETSYFVTFLLLRTCLKKYFWYWYGRFPNYSAHIFR